MICGQPKPRGWSFVPGKPLVRGYDTSTLFREATPLQIQHTTPRICLPDIEAPCVPCLWI